MKLVALSLFVSLSLSLSLSSNFKLSLAASAPSVTSGCLCLYLMCPKPGHPKVKLSSHRSELCSSFELRRSPWAQPDTSWSHLETPQKHSKRPDLTEKLAQSESRHPGLSQSSQATLLELWASPDLLGPPGTQLDSSWSHLETPRSRENDQT
jgi:hypothetical protein